MKYLPLVWAGIWRKPGRAILTLLSIVNAFLLFGLLQGFVSRAEHAVAETHADVLLTASRVSQLEPLPMSQLAQIRDRARRAAARRPSWCSTGYLPRRRRSSCAASPSIPTHSPPPIRR